MIPQKVKEVLEKQHYRIVGGHSAVQICRWTKNSLKGKGVCWKEKFYGIQSHRCCQMTPSVMWCENQCLHCWRAIEMNLGMDIGKIDEPKKILDEIIEARKKLLMGFKGSEKVSKKKFEEALKSNFFTLSLSGEPTLYPKVGELIKEIKKRNAISFLVTNGQNPEVIKKLEKEGNLPTQITVSMNAPNEKLFLLWHRSLRKDAWKRFNQTLEIIKKLKGKTRRAIRLTLVRESNKGLFNMNEESIKEYATLIKKAEPDFVHVKGFMSVGYARKRLGYDKMPFWNEIKEFAKKLAKETGLKLLGEHEYSRAIILGKNKKDLKIEI